MSMNHHLPKKVDLTPRKHHGFQVLLFILGMLLPPLAVAARFGIDIPGHGHNTNPSSNKARTPKWAIRYGLVNSADQDRRARKSQWAKRYDERLPESTLVGQGLAEGEEGNDYDPRPKDNDRRQNEGLWTREDELYYNDDNEAPNQRTWHYPANFEGTVGDGRSKRRPAKEQPAGDRFERTRRARAGSSDSYGTYPPRASTDEDVPDWGRDYGSKGRRSSKGNRNSGHSYDAPAPAPRKQGNSGNSDDVFNHEF